MRKYFVRTFRWVAIVAIMFQGFAVAEEAFTLGPSSSENVIAQPETATLEKKAPLFRHSSYPAAWTAAQKSNRPILVFVSMPQCPYCVKMMEKTCKRPEVVRMISSSFEPVYVGRFTHAKLVKQLDVKWYPTTILVGPNNKVLDVIEGYVDAQTFQRRLQTGLAAASSATRTR